MRSILATIKKFYHQVIKSFAFVPAIIAISFLAFSILMLELDFSSLGKHIKASAEFIRLKDASTARTVVATILAGIISLTVFSFSNVMILLNQAASQLSNRILQTLIQNRFQQTVLGFYIGTIVYSLFLLSSIRDIDSGIYVPALSIYLLVLFTICDIFLFIYFLHYITQTVKFNIVIKNIHRETAEALKKATVKMRIK